jgi:hypothetical protein
MGAGLASRSDWSPSIDSIGFIAAPLNECTEELSKWRKSLFGGSQGVVVESGNWSLDEKMAKLDSLLSMRRGRFSLLHDRLNGPRTSTTELRVRTPPL